ncbi:MAG: hypothetical protein GFH27_549413n7 [Chloroflexi bacterium AL-W]|nr:hypothetical protein [Chloroflexi bacterium AL-N1]NOK71405.1 hypothetical protein [Chloroflexi bacterium AL-N10]NOK78808.1 hypothetical protein [Chloroflexi bacterium AL-N5]NOK86226.1 hypothetical protein [Chloroflexi bacterium AL-W]NOK93130.1 hypothetical protein [Chloroflexi bacterium AL-N15]
MSKSHGDTRHVRTFPGQLMKILYSSNTVIVVLAILLIAQIIQNQWLLRRSDTGIATIEPSLIGTQLTFPTLYTVNGAEYQFTEGDGTANLLIYFHTDCTFCHADVPLWKKMYEQASERSINIVGVTEEGDIDAITEFVDSYQLTFPVLLDPDRQLLDQVDASVTPTKVLVSSDEQIAQIWRGLTTQQSGDGAIGGIVSTFGIDPQVLPLHSESPIP